MKRKLLLICVLLGLAVVCFPQAQAQATTAQSTCVMERVSKRVLFAQNEHQKLPMASTTKIVTALTVLESGISLSTQVAIHKQAVGVEGSSIYLREGEHLTVKELLLGLMLRSGNDCAVALALTVGGSVENFAKLMNQCAQSHGLAESHFVTPHGLHNDDHYTTAYDLAKISCVALGNPQFAEIVSTKSARISNEGMEYDRVLNNKNKLLFSFEGADGVKTGYTKKAGRCFVGSATKNGMQVVAVVLNCGPMFEEAAELLKTAFNSYTLECALPKNKLCGVIYRKGKPTYYIAEQGFFYPTKAGEKLERKIILDENCQKVLVLLDGQTVYERFLTAMS